MVEIYERYGALMLRRCRDILRDQSLADDALQDAFVNLMRYGAQFRAAEAKLRWLYKLSDRCCFRILNRRHRLAERELEGGIPESSGASQAFEDRDMVMRILVALNDKERRIAVLAFVDGFSQSEISAEIGWSRQTVNKKLKTIRAKAQILRGKQ